MSRRSQHGRTNGSEPPGRNQRAAPPASSPSSDERPIRAVLQTLRPDPTTHAGLWLDRFLPAHDKTKADGEKKGTRQDHIKGMLRTLKVPAAYRSHFARWRAHFDRLQAEGAAVCASAEVRGRMAVGLGAASVLEVAITLHHTYGTPLIPGSALKGLAASYARNRLSDDAWRPSGASFRALFGEHTEAGGVAFHDALWIPEQDADLPLDLDVMTVHHGQYYTTPEKPPPPADSDDPNPVPFVTARGSYLLVVEGPPQWTDAAMGILKLALREEGIGAKTAAGYGRLALQHQTAEEQAEAEVIAAQAIAKKREEKLAQMIGNLAVNTAGDALPEIFALAPTHEHRAIAERCLVVLGKKAVKKALKNDKKWVKALTRALEGGPADGTGQ